MIAIFSKFDMAGGSERRCIELANGIAKYTKHSACILAEGNFPDSLNELVDEGVLVVKKALLQEKYLTEADAVIVVNTDCKEFSTLDYWQGKSHRHNVPVNIGGVRKMLFLYNFLVSPSRHLHELHMDTDVSIITTNRKFFDEITKQDRYEHVRILPRHILNSPIDPESVTQRVRKKALVFGCHSKRLGSKWNTDWPKLIEEVQARSPVEFKFMGMKNEVAEATGLETCFKENQISVKAFLDMLDVFVFFPSYKREEPWARVIGEAMMAGLPIIALNKGGTPDQVLQDHNGRLCKKLTDYHKAITYMVEHPAQVERMSRNSIRIAKDFTTEKTIKKLTEILWA